MVNWRLFEVTCVVTSRIESYLTLVLAESDHKFSQEQMVMYYRSHMTLKTFRGKLVAKLGHIWQMVVVGYGPCRVVGRSCVDYAAVSKLFHVFSPCMRAQVFARKCFLYSNGLMDHLCPRVNGDPPPVATHTREEICNCRLELFLYNQAGLTHLLCEFDASSS